MTAKVSENSVKPLPSVTESAHVQYPFVAHCKADGTILVVNQALCDSMGVSEAELVGASYINLTHPDDLEIIYHHLAYMTPHTPMIQPYRQRFVIGDRIFVHEWITMGRFDSNGALTETFGIGRDVTHEGYAEN